MTNTGDFRRYSYGSDAAYAVQALRLRLIFRNPKKNLR